MRQPQVFGNADGRHGICSCKYGAQYKGEGPCHSRDNIICQYRDAGGCKKYESYGKRADGIKIVPEALEGNIKSSVIQKRRKEQQQYDLGIDLHRRHGRDTTQNYPAYHQYNRIGDFDFFRPGGKPDHYCH